MPAGRPVYAMVGMENLHVSHFDELRPYVETAERPERDEDTLGLEIKQFLMELGQNDLIR